MFNITNPTTRTKAVKVLGGTVDLKPGETKKGIDIEGDDVYLARLSAAGLVLVDRAKAAAEKAAASEVTAKAEAEKKVAEEVAAKKATDFKKAT